MKVMVLMMEGGDDDGNASKTNQTTQKTYKVHIGKILEVFEEF